jgi:hypothetical protein
MKRYILLAFSLILACQTAQITSQPTERAGFDSIEVPELRFLALGSSIDMGGIMQTKLEGYKDKFIGDLDRSKVKVRVPAASFLRTIFAFVLLGMGLIWFFYPRIKKMLTPQKL